jgi:hypothetical protein
LWPGSVETDCEAGRTEAFGSANSLESSLLFEIELHARAVRIDDEELPNVRIGLNVDVVRNAGSVEAGGDCCEVACAEGHVIENTTPFRRERSTGDHVENRPAAGVEPCARESERRTRAFAQAEHVDVEGARSVEVVREEREVVHPDDGHDAVIVRNNGGVSDDGLLPDMSESEEHDAETETAGFTRQAVLQGSIITGAALGTRRLQSSARGWPCGARSLRLLRSSRVRRARARDSRVR